MGREEDEPVRRMDSRRKEAGPNKREDDEPVRRIDSRRKEAGPNKREDDEPVRRMDSRRKEAGPNKREDDEPVRRIDSRRRGVVSSRRGEDWVSRRLGEKRRELVLSQLDRLTWGEAIQDKKQLPETNIFNEQETDGAVKELSDTKLVLKFNEKTTDDISCWTMIGLKSLKKIIPGTIQDMFLEQAIPMVLTLGLIQKSQRKAAF